jgi:hypothetical protein
MENTKLEKFYLPRHPPSEEMENEPKFFNDKIKKSIAVLAGKEGFSFKQIASDGLWNLIYTCMDQTNLGRQKEQRIIPDSVVEKPSRKFISKCVQEEGEKEYLRLKNVYEGEYVSLAVDAGNFKGHDYYVGIIYTPYQRKETVPPLLVCFEESIKTQSEIAHTIATTINNVQEYAKIMSIIVDGLKHQVQAAQLFPTSKLENYQQFINNLGNPLPFLLPDIPHLFQLVLTHARDNSELLLGDYINEVDKIGVDIRKNQAVKHIGARCPT